MLRNLCMSHGPAWTGMWWGGSVELWQVGRHAMVVMIARSIIPSSLPWSAAESVPFRYAGPLGGPSEWRWKHAWA